MSSVPSLWYPRQHSNISCGAYLFACGTEASATSSHRIYRYTRLRIAKQDPTLKVPPRPHENKAHRTTMTWLMPLLAAPALMLAALVVGTIYNLVRNYREALTMGVPIRVAVISPMNPFWALIDRKVVRFLRKLPFGENSFTRFNWRGWEIHDRYRAFHEMGDVWVLVNPFKNWLYIADPDAAMELFRRGNDFERPAFMNGTSNVHQKVGWYPRSWN